MTRIKTDKLLIAEKFYSCQCEGFSTGRPAYFIRMALCNLSCGFSPSYVNDFKKGKIEQKQAGTIVGDLQESGKATWTCDSMPVWVRGEEREFQQIIDDWKSEGIYEDICKGLIHIIWTGGEPTIHQDSIVNFFRYWREHDPESRKVIPMIQTDKLNAFSEIETNGTVFIEPFLFQQLDQINCSPKLSNSGMTRNQRIIPKAIERIMQHSNYQFKFVISNEEDIAEMFIDYIEPFNIPLQNVCCMPGMDHQDQFFERTRWVLEMAKKYRFSGLTRLHIAAWNQACGV